MKSPAPDLHSFPQADLGLPHSQNLTHCPVPCICGAVSTPAQSPDSEEGEELFLTSV